MSRYIQTKPWMTMHPSFIGIVSNTRFKCWFFGILDQILIIYRCFNLFKKAYHVILIAKNDLYVSLLVHSPLNLDVDPGNILKVILLLSLFTFLMHVKVNCNMQLYSKEFRYRRIIIIRDRAMLSYSVW